MPTGYAQTDRNVVCKYLFYKFRYSNGSPHFIQLPMVHTHLRSKSADFDTIALIDSGATQTLIPRELADILDIEYDKDKDGKTKRALTEGAGGTFDSLIGKVAQVDLIKNVTQFCTFHGLSVWVPEKVGLLPYMVFGRDAVFKRFDITFEEQRRRMVFRRV